MKTRTVTFSFGTVKNASLKIPAEAHNLVQAAELIRESYLDWAFRPGCGLMSDEVLTSSIGHSNFFAGALGGWETRLTPESFKSLKSLCLENDMGMAIAVARYRMPGAERSEIYLRASENEVLEESAREFLSGFANEAQKLVEAATV